MTAQRRNQRVLVIGQRLSGVGVASSIAVGAALVLLSAVVGQFWGMAVGMPFFGAAQASGLQARYAAVGVMMMNFGTAGMAALAGPILAVGGFLWVNIAAPVVLVPMVALGIRALRAPAPRPAVVAPAASVARETEPADSN